MNLHPMINFIKGKVNIGGEDILAGSDEELSILARDGIIEKRSDAVGIYYYVEDETGGMRFGVFIRLREKNIQWLVLHWQMAPALVKDGMA